MSKTTLDLSTLSDIADGTHTVKVKAKADGYNDSEFSNEVSYTKAIATVNIRVRQKSVYTPLYYTQILDANGHRLYTTSYNNVVSEELYDAQGDVVAQPLTLNLPITVYGYGYSLTENGEIISASSTVTVTDASNIWLISANKD